MRYAVLFPGQGSQFVGMGADLFASRPDLLGPVADDVLGWSLRELCANGPEGELTRTDRAQPALYAVSYALYEALVTAVGFAPSGAAGHSLGEYTALAASGAMGYEEGLRLVAARGSAMDEVARDVPSGMAALLGTDLDTAQALVRERLDGGGRLWVANVNAPGQVVLAGADQDIAWLVENARDLGIRRAIPLKVAGGFHSPLMEPASRRLATALGNVDFRAPSYPVWANHSAAPTVDIVQDLTLQLSNTVRFSESLVAMAAAGIQAFVHVGPGDVTAGMAKRSVGDAGVVVVSSLEDVDAAAAVLAVQ